MSQPSTNNNSLESQLIPILFNNGKEGLKNLIFYQVITKGVPVILKGALSVMQSVMNKRIKKHLENISMMSVRQKTSSVLLQRDYEKDNDMNLLFDAVLSYVSELSQTKHVKRTTTGVFIMATTDEIEMSPCIFVRKVAEYMTNDKISKLTIEVYSYIYDLSTLRKYMEDIEEKYQMAMSNQLGKNIFYFDELPVSLPLGMNRKPDLAKAPPRLAFSKYPLHTNKSLKNIYGDSVKVIRKRVDFFVNNKRWYEQQGVPYTLGLLLHGVPGAGKTSCIKSIAKDTNRHVLNIRLSESTTVNQLNALFYSSQVQVVQNGENKFYDIPIEKRIIVLEDVDCLTDVVLSREAVEKNKPCIVEKETNKNSGTKNDEYDKYGRLVENNNFAENQKLNLSILLNILDGVLEQPGRILIMTSNHPEKLDKALIRPGRIDVIVNFDYCKRHEVIEIIEAFTGKEVHSSLACKIADAIYTPAEVTKVIFEHIENIDAIINNLTGSELIKEVQVNIDEGYKLEPETIYTKGVIDKNVSEIKGSVEVINEDIKIKPITNDIQAHNIENTTHNIENTTEISPMNETVNDMYTMIGNLSGKPYNTVFGESNFDIMFGKSNESHLDDFFNTSILTK